MSTKQAGAARRKPAPAMKIAPLGATSVTLELLDPDQVIIRNVREAEPDQWLIDSIAEIGLMQFVGVLRTPEGELHLRFGQRRLKACAQLGYLVPSLVVDGTAGTPADEIERILQQMEENDNRKDLTAAERISGVQELFEYGADQKTVERRTRLDTGQIAAARKAARSETARTLAAQYPLTLDQAATLAEFDDDPEAATALARVAQNQPNQFAHSVEARRLARADAAIVAERVSELTAQGVKVTGQRPAYDLDITYWSQDRKQLTPEVHKSCPGNVVHVYIWGGHDGRQARESWYCTDPQGSGHKKFRASQAGERSEEEQAEVKRIRDGNTAWRAATTVRQRYLGDVLLARHTPPAGAIVFCARAVAACEPFLLNAMSTNAGGPHALAREMLGGIEKNTNDWKTQTRTSPLADSLTGTVGVSVVRAEMAILTMILCAYEEMAAADAWRTPRQPLREYLTALAGWGYSLSEAEQAAIAAVAPDVPAEPADGAA